MYWKPKTLLCWQTILCCIVEAMVFLVVIYRCESWTIKKEEFRRTDAFELSCWKRLLRVPWIARRSNHSILKEINPECLLEGLILKLKLRYFGHQMQRKDPDAGKDWGQQEKEVAEDEMVGWHYCFSGHELRQTLGDGDGQGSLKCCSPWGWKELDMTWLLNNNNLEMQW